MSSHSPKVSEGIVHGFSKSVLECSAGVFRDTLHESFRNTHQEFHHHTAIIGRPVLFKVAVCCAV